MWGSRYFTARYWTSRYFSATGLDPIPCNVDQTTLINDAPFDNTTLLAENADNTSLITGLIESTTLINNAPSDNTSLITDFADSTTELCRV